LNGRLCDLQAGLSNLRKAPVGIAEGVVMKKALAIVIALATGCTAETAPELINAADRSSPAPQDITQPYQDITQFYRDWNYAASFSTPAERSRLRLVADLDEAKGLSQRLKTVFSRLKNIEFGIQKIDVGGPGRLAPPGYPVGAELADLVDIRKKGPTIAVRVKFWPLLPPDNALLVASYEERREKIPVPDVRQLRSLLQSAPRTEIHTWTSVDGGWMRNEANLVLLQK